MRRGPTPPAQEPFHYTASGLPDVWLVNGFHRQETTHGPAVRIEDAEGLHLALARAIVTAKKPFAPAELRFLRKLLALSQANVARLLGVTDQTVARWEKGETNFDSAAERLVRFIVLERLGKDVIVLEELKALAEQDEELHGAHRLERAGKTWRRAA
jgi:DNA-binding transcriptional regulator YiaG